MNQDWWIQPARAIDEAAQQAARERQNQLTKPPGALGRLEWLAERLAGLQGRERPELERIMIVVFAADHGVAAESVSAFPQDVTVEMIRNFSRGGAAISVMADLLGAQLEVVDVGAARDPGPLAGVIQNRVAAGTANFTEGPAMGPAECAAAIDAGAKAVERAQASGIQLFIGGEMGIANTTSAAALACALLQVPPRRMTGPGTGLNAAGIEHKAEVIERALARHAYLKTPLDRLAALGGFEIAALTGAYVRCAQRGIPVLVDGFIASLAALVAVHLNDSVKPWLIFSHTSAEPGHQYILHALDVEPLLDLGMRLGEGSGAAVAVPLLRSALALHAGMATFAEAGVSDQPTESA